MTERIQYKRGVHLPENTRLVARPSRWGNPFRLVYLPHDKAWTVVYPESWYGPIWRSLFPDREAAHAAAVDLFALHAGPMGMYEIKEADLALLHGMDLACYCPLDLPCHADILLEWAARFNVSPR